MHLLIDLDHFLFPSETVLVLSAGAQGREEETLASAEQTRCFVFAHPDPAQSLRLQGHRLGRKR